MKKRKSVSYSVVLGLVASGLMFQVPSSLGRPGSIITSIEAPSSAPPTEKRDIDRGSSKYASKTGAFEYSYPLVVPPGRVGMEPSIALSYTSQGSLRGGVAQNWSLSGTHMIQRDTSDGSVGAAVGSSNSDALPFTSSLSGGHRLVPVTEPVASGWQAYRAEYDDQFVRYERNESDSASSIGIWRARTLDGKTWYFGGGHEGEYSSVSNSTKLLQDSSGTGYAGGSNHLPLTRVVDKFGNEVRYYWEVDYQDARIQELTLSEILYSENATAGLESHARVKFNYAPNYTFCGTPVANKTLPVGASVSYRDGHPWYQGRRQLQTIETFATYPDLAREERIRLYQLDISNECPAGAGPFRRLDAIRTMDPNSPTTDLAPPVSFGYGSPARNFAATRTSNAVAPPGGYSHASIPLTWGRTHGYTYIGESEDYGAEPTLEQMLLDLNGDGRLDILQAVQGGASCGFKLYRRAANGVNLEAEMTVDLPDEGMPWAVPGSRSAGEGCSLSGRRTLWGNGSVGNETCARAGNYLDYRFMDVNRDGLPDLVTSKRMDGRYINASMLDFDTDPDAIPGISGLLNPLLVGIPDNGKCRLPSGANEDASDALVGTGMCQFADMEVLNPMLDGEIGYTCGNFQSVVMQDPTAEDSWTYDLETYTSGCSQPATVALENNGHFPWTVYVNRFNEPGFDPTTDDIFDLAGGERIWSPIPLDPPGAESSVGGGIGLSSGKHGVLDITGDGVIDAIVKPYDANPDFPYWQVFPGALDSSGDFIGFEEYPIWWTIPSGAAISQSTSDANAGRTETQQISLAQLQDMNADGLPDLLQKKSTGGIEVALNMGSGFCANGDGILPAENEVLTGSALSRTGYSYVSGFCAAIDKESGLCTNVAYPQGEGTNVVRTADIDGDGLPDFYDAWDDTSFDGVLHYTYRQASMGGGGGGFEYPNDVESCIDSTCSMEQLHLTRKVSVDGDYGSWAVTHDIIDLDGDGIEDMVSPSGGSSWQLDTQQAVQGRAVRLLNSIDNGQGLVTEVEYAHYNDPEVAIDASSQAGMPSHITVVSKVRSESQLIGGANFSPDSEVKLKYGDPVYNEDNHGRRGFRGFTVVQSSAPYDIRELPEHSMTEERYAYDKDWSGRLEEVIVYADGFSAQEAATVRHIRTEENSLFSGASLSYYTYRTKEWNCETSTGDFASYATCTALPPVKHTKHESVALYAGPALAYYQPYNYTTQLKTHTGDTQGDVSETLYQVLQSSADRYLLLPDLGYGRVYEAGTGWVEKSHTDWKLEPNTKLYNYRERHGSWSGPRYVTYRDADTGLVTESRQPEEYYTGVATTYHYSGFKISPDTVVNELGHPSTSKTDMGTGATLEAFGPNFLPCDGTKNAGTKTVYDKLARPVQVFEVGCGGAGGTYLEALRTQISYTDFSAGNPASVTTTTYHSATDPSDRTTSTVYVDGAGRTIKTMVDDGTPEGLVSTYHYNDRGLLERFVGPNPSTQVGAPATVDVTVAYDSLGRTTGVRQGTDTASAPLPGDAGWDNFVGVDTSYGFDGVHSIKTTSEHITDGGPAAETVTYIDWLGRLIYVDERLEAGAYARTAYEYDGNDNARKIQDPDGVTTLMEHNTLSQRTKVKRGEREWTYAYDANGNLVAETTPNDLGETADNQGAGLYTTTFVYDKLNRPTSRLIAPRTLSSAELDRFDAHSVSYFYDSCTNGLGRLCSVDSGDFLHTSLTYDYAGRVIDETQSIDLPSDVVGSTYAPFSFSKGATTSYKLSGQIAQATLADGTEFSYGYSELGEPESVTYAPSSASPVTSTVVRNKARRTTGQTLGCLSRSWDYDHLGRVISNMVQGGAGAVACGTQNDILLSEDMVYSESSEVMEHAVYRAGIGQRFFGYDYDSRHQLIEAQDSHDNYNVRFTHTDNGRMATVAAPSAAGIQGRYEQTYAYGDKTLAGADEHAPVQLSGPLRNLDYSYDFAGNVTSRQETTDYGEGASETFSWQFLYDGADQQREVTSATSFQTMGQRERYYYDASGQRYMSVLYESVLHQTPERIRIWMGGSEFWLEPSGGELKVSTSYGHFGIGALQVGRIEKQYDSQGSVIATKKEGSFHNGRQHLMGAVDWESGAVTAAYVYGPYGEILESTGGETETHLRRFNGKESDQISQLSYYGFRYYDEASMAWTQADPQYRFEPDFAAHQPRRANLYQFSGNNPIRFLDPDGRDFGDEFASPDAAALDFAMTLNGPSIQIEREIGTRIYSATNADGETYYSYSQPIAGDRRSVDPTKSRIPEGGELIAHAHTHADALGSKDSSPSNEDLEFVSYSPLGRDFVATPAGELRTYNRKGEIETIATNLPSDPDAKNRRNKISSEVSRAPTAKEKERVTQRGAGAHKRIGRKSRTPRKSGRKKSIKRTKKPGDCAGKNCKRTNGL